jgi:hypothetical protein
MPDQLKPDHGAAAQGRAVHRIAEVTADKDQVLQAVELYNYGDLIPRETP